MKFIFFICSIFQSVTLMASYIVPDNSIVPTKYNASGVASQAMLNLGLAASVSAGAMTISIKNQSGSDASANSPIRISFRSATATSGVYSLFNVSSALSIVIPSGATLGMESAIQSYIYVYAQNNSGSVQLCASANGFLDEGSPQTSTTISGTAQSSSVLYCAAGATGPVRLIGRMASTQASIGTWASAPTEISVTPFNQNQVGTPNAPTGLKIIYAVLSAACTTNGPCALDSNSGVTAITRISVGQYQVSYNEFKDIPFCTGTSYSYITSVVSVTKSLMTIQNYNSVPNLADAVFSIMCVGKNK